LTSIVIVSSKTVKVEVDAIVERHVIAPMKAVIKYLEWIVEEWIASGLVPEID